MSVVLLIRHGQASFGAADYDQLSPQGEVQAGIVGAALAERNVVPTRIVAGSMKRHAQTAAAAVGAAGWMTPVQVDAGWNEFDHVQVLSAHGAPDDEKDALDRRGFQEWFERATRRWMAGTHDEEYDESFSAFAARVDGALDRVVDGLGSGETAVVFTSGGAIGQVATRLLAGTTEQWERLNSVTANASITKLVVGRSGVTLVSFNDHVHLEPDHVTYR